MDGVEGGFSKDDSDRLVQRLQQQAIKLFQHCTRFQFRLQIPKR
jgi:hypothetical protein